MPAGEEERRARFMQDLLGMTEIPEAAGTGKARRMLVCEWRACKFISEWRTIFVRRRRRTRRLRCHDYEALVTAIAKRGSRGDRTGRYSGGEAVPRSRSSSGIDSSSRWVTKFSSWLAEISDPVTILRPEFCPVEGGTCGKWLAYARLVAIVAGIASRSNSFAPGARLCEGGCAGGGANPRARDRRYGCGRARRSDHRISNKERSNRFPTLRRRMFPKMRRCSTCTVTASFPGLVGMHDHMFYPMGNGIFGEMAYSFPRLYLAGGVTTIRTTGAIEPYTDLELKKQIDNGETPGPKIHVTGPYLEGAGHFGAADASTHRRRTTQPRQ